MKQGFTLYDHRLVGVAFVPSPNCDPRPQGVDIELVVIHGISLPPGHFGGPYIEQLFTNSLDEKAHPYFAQIADLRVSAHLLIRRNGDLVQFVPFNLRAWHAGVSSWGGRSRCNDFSIGIELEGTDTVPYTDQQYATLNAVLETLQAHYPIKGVAGHCHIAPGRKLDPGPSFDWDRLEGVPLKFSGR
jgi:AmpD protein